MPFVRISLREGKQPTYLKAVSEAVHRAMVETINVPADDRFQVVTEHPAGGLVYDPGYLGVRRSDDLLVVQITLNQGRTLEQKKALYARIAQLLSEVAKVRPEDVLISLVEVPKENWSFGRGEASYVK